MIITESQLWDYADGLLEVAKKNEIESALKNDLHLQNLYQEILQQQRLLRAQQIIAPKKDFANQVMLAWQATQNIEIQETEPSKDWGVRIIMGVLIGLLVFSLILCFFNLKGIATPSMSIFTYKSIYTIGLIKLFGLVAILFIDQYRHYKKQIAAFG
jgi:hypothetical protein